MFLFLPCCLLLNYPMGTFSQHVWPTLFCPWPLEQLCCTPCSPFLLVRTSMSTSRVTSLSPTFNHNGPQDVFPSLGYSGNQQELMASGYNCPRCKTKTSELPSECIICNLPLVSSPHLARSYHHLFPVPHFEETIPPCPQGRRTGPTKETAQPSQAPYLSSGGVKVKAGAGERVATTGTTGLGIQGPQAGRVVKMEVVEESPSGPPQPSACAGCLRQLISQSYYRCPDCKSVFCLDCDMYIHDSLHNCPGCC
ncbi:unnamed protein product [Choristocarpus tenellus]